MDEKILANVLQAVSQKAEANGNNYLAQDVDVDGFDYPRESPGAYTGLLTGKGTLADGKSLDNCLYGGVYYLGSAKNNPSNPFAWNGTNYYRAMVTMVRLFGDNQLTSDPIVVQTVQTLNLTGGNQKAYRIYMWGKWNPWIYPQGKRLWSGTSAMNGTTIPLTDNIYQFARLKVGWQPYNSHGHIPELIMSTSMAQHEFTNTNRPDQITGTRGSVEEVLLKFTTGTSITLDYKYWYDTPSGIQYDSTISNNGGARLLYIDGFTERG